MPASGSELVLDQWLRPRYPNSYQVQWQFFAFGVPFVQTKPKNEEANHVVSSLRKTMAAEHVQIQVAVICNCGVLAKALRRVFQ